MSALVLGLLLFVDSIERVHAWYDAVQHCRGAGCTILIADFARLSASLGGMYLFYAFAKYRGVSHSIYRRVLVYSIAALLPTLVLLLYASAVLGLPVYRFTMSWLGDPILFTLVALAIAALVRRVVSKAGATFSRLRGDSA